MVIRIPPITEEEFISEDKNGACRLYLGTFDSEQAIEALRNSPLLKGKTFETTLRNVSGDRPWYRLTAVGFKSAKDARKVLAGLREQGLLPPVTASP